MAEESGPDSALPYKETVNAYGETEKHVMAVVNGENAFLLELDQFLQSSGGQS